MIEELMSMFMVYSILGWCWETPYVSIRQKKWINRGFLHGPMIPIYGFAAVTIMTSMHLIKDYLPHNLFIKVIIAVIYIALVASVWEYMTSFVLEKLFHTRWWDYRDHAVNLNGRIALDYSIGWGIGGYLLWRFVNVQLILVIHNIPKELLHIILAVFYTLFIIDCTATIRELLSLKKIMNELNILSEELADKVMYRVENLNVELELRKRQFKNTLEEVKEELRLFYEDKTNEIKENIKLRKRELGENMLLMMQRKETSITEKQKNAIERFNILLQSSKRFSRFYKNYPKASSLKFENILSIVRYKKKHEK